MDLCDRTRETRPCENEAFGIETPGLEGVRQLDKLQLYSIQERSIARRQLNEGEC